MNSSGDRVNFLSQTIIGLKAALTESAKENQTLQKLLLSLYVKDAARETNLYKMNRTGAKMNEIFQKEKQELTSKIRELEDKITDTDRQNVNLNFQVKELKAFLKEKTNLLELYNCKESKLEKHVLGTYKEKDLVQIIKNVLVCMKETKVSRELRKCFKKLENRNSKRDLKLVKVEGDDTKTGHDINALSITAEDRLKDDDSVRFEKNISSSSLAILDTFETDNNNSDLNFIHSRNGSSHEGIDANQPCLSPSSIADSDYSSNGVKSVESINLDKTNFVELRPVVSVLIDDSSKQLPKFSKNVIEIIQSEDSASDSEDSVECNQTLFKRDVLDSVVDTLLDEMYNMSYSSHVIDRFKEFSFDDVPTITSSDAKQSSTVSNLNSDESCLQTASIANNENVSPSCDDSQTKSSMFKLNSDEFCSRKTSIANEKNSSSSRDDGQDQNSSSSCDDGQDQNSSSSCDDGQDQNSSSSCDDGQTKSSPISKLNSDEFCTGMISIACDKNSSSSCNDGQTKLSSPTSKLNSDEFSSQTASIASDQNSSSSCDDGQTKLNSPTSKLNSDEFFSRTASITNDQNSSPACDIGQTFKISDLLPSSDKLLGKRKLDFDSFNQDEVKKYKLNQNLNCSSKHFESNTSVIAKELEIIPECENHSIEILSGVQSENIGSMDHVIFSENELTEEICPNENVTGSSRNDVLTSESVCINNSEIADPNDRVKNSSWNNIPISKSANTASIEEVFGQSIVNNVDKKKSEEHSACDETMKLDSVIDEQHTSSNSDVSDKYIPSIFNVEPIPEQELQNISFPIPVSPDVVETSFNDADVAEKKLNIDADVSNELQVAQSVVNDASDDDLSNRPDKTWSVFTNLFGSDEELSNKEVRTSVDTSETTVNYYEKSIELPDDAASSPNYCSSVSSLSEKSESEIDINASFVVGVVPENIQNDGKTKSGGDFPISQNVTDKNFSDKIISSSLEGAEGRKLTFISETSIKSSDVFESEILLRKDEEKSSKLDSSNVLKSIDGTLSDSVQICDEDKSLPEISKCELNVESIKNDTCLSNVTLREESSTFGGTSSRNSVSECSEGCSENDSNDENVSQMFENIDVHTILSEFDSLGAKILEGSTIFKEFSLKEASRNYQNVSDESDSVSNTPVSDGVEYIVVAEILPNGDNESENTCLNDYSVNDDVVHALREVDLKTIEFEPFTSHACDQLVPASRDEYPMEESDDCDEEENALIIAEDDFATDTYKNSSFVGTSPSKRTIPVNVENSNATNGQQVVGISHEVKLNLKDDQPIKEITNVPRYNLRHLTATNNITKNFEKPSSTLMSCTEKSVLCENEIVDSVSNVTRKDDKKTAQKMKMKFYVEHQTFDSYTLPSAPVSVFEEIWDKIKCSRYKVFSVDALNEVELVPCPLSVLNLLQERRRFLKNAKKTECETPNEGTFNLRFVKQSLEKFLKEKSGNYSAASAEFLSVIRQYNSRSICRAMTEVLSDYVNKERILENVLREFILLCTKIDVRIFPGFINVLKDHLKTTMFVKNLKFEAKVNGYLVSFMRILSKFFTRLCKLTNDASAAVIFLKDTLCSFRFRGHIIAHSLLQEWPEIFPQDHAERNFLTHIILFTIVNHKFEYNRQLYKFDDILQMIDQHYKVKLGMKTAEEFAKELMLNLNDDTWNDAITLLCKRQLFYWTYINVIMKYFVPILLKWTSEIFPEEILLKVLRALGTLLGSCPHNKKENEIYHLDMIVNALEQILVCEKGSRQLKETVVIVLGDCSSFQLLHCKKILSSWKPADGAISVNALQELHERMTKCYKFGYSRHKSSKETKTYPKKKGHFCRGRKTQQEHANTTTPSESAGFTKKFKIGNENGVKKTTKKKKNKKKKRREKIV